MRVVRVRSGPVWILLVIPVVLFFLTVLRLDTVEKDGELMNGLGAVIAEPNRVVESAKRTDANSSEATALQPPCPARDQKKPPCPAVRQTPCPSCTGIKPKHDEYTKHCTHFTEGNFTKYDEAKLLMRFHPEKHPLKEAELILNAQNCESFRSSRGYRTMPSPGTEDMPVAYSIVFHKDTGQVERLIRSLYQPQNVFCLHVDKKASDLVHKATSALASCFDNVFIASQLERVVYASFSRLQADINCMKDFVSSRYPSWKYFINLTGQVFPLQSNKEIAKILHIYNGANDIEGSGRGVYTGVAHRYEYEWKVLKEDTDKPIMGRVSKKATHPPPPHNITLVKGSAFGVFSRAFVQYVLSNSMAWDLLEWSKDTYSPDEVYWATLNHPWVNPMLNAPGAYTDTIPDRKPWMAMYASWKSSIPRGKCSLGYTRNICIFTLRDLPYLNQRKELFANKFYAEKEPMVIDCLQKRNDESEASNVPFDAQFYRDLPFVKN